MSDEECQHRDVCGVCDGNGDSCIDGNIAVATGAVVLLSLLLATVLLVWLVLLVRTKSDTLKRMMNSWRGKAEGRKRHKQAKREEVENRKKSWKQRMQEN
mmetsp:Transcript_34941/g.90533  ORF Transcript_34941/g.90533 Transcript_34941/m.90533 type:complete len:100 (+) Transcript_34941:531-830(+)